MFPSTMILSTWEEFPINSCVMSSNTFLGSDTFKNLATTVLKQLPSVARYWFIAEYCHLQCMGSASLCCPLSSCTSIVLSLKQNTEIYMLQFAFNLLVREAGSPQGSGHWIYPISCLGILILCWASWSKVRWLLMLIYNSNFMMCTILVYISGIWGAGTTILFLYSTVEFCSVYAASF